MRSRSGQVLICFWLNYAVFVSCAQKQREKWEVELGHLSTFGWATFVFVSRWEHILPRYNRTGWLAVKHQVNTVQRILLLLTFWAHLPKHSKMLEEWVNECGWQSRTDLGDCTHTQYDETQGNNSTYCCCVCVTYFERWLTRLCLKYKLFVVVVVLDVVVVVVVVYAGAD